MENDKRKNYLTQEIRNKASLTTGSQNVAKKKQ